MGKSTILSNRQLALSVLDDEQLARVIQKLWPKLRAILSPRQGINEPVWFDPFEISLSGQRVLYSKQANFKPVVIAGLNENDLIFNDLVFKTLRRFGVTLYHLAYGDSELTSLGSYCLDGYYQRAPGRFSDFIHDVLEVGKQKDGPVPTPRQAIKEIDDQFKVLFPKPAVKVKPSSKTAPETTAEPPAATAAKAKPKSKSRSKSDKSDKVAPPVPTPDPTTAPTKLTIMTRADSVLIEVNTSNAAYGQFNGFHYGDVIQKEGRDPETVLGVGSDGCFWVAEEGYKWRAGCWIKFSDVSNHQFIRPRSPKLLRFDLDRKIEEFMAFYAATGVAVPENFWRDIRLIWVRNLVAIQEALDEMDFDEILLIPPITDLADLAEKMKTTAKGHHLGVSSCVESEWERLGGWSRIQSPHLNQKRIVLVHKDRAQNLSDRPELANTKAIFGRDVDFGNAMSLEEYLIFQKRYSEDTNGLHLDSDKSQSWLAIKWLANRIIFADWQTDNNQLYLWASSPDDRYQDKGYRPCRRFF